MRYNFKCVICDKECSVIRDVHQRIPKTCSRECFYKKKKVWACLSQEDREKHIREYYERNVIKQDGCWDWKKACKTEKYIRMNYCRTEPKLAIHIYSYRIHNGEVPEGMCVMHKCDNRRCSNPDHLFLGTNYDNILDMISKRRHPHGESHGHAKLTEEQVKTIRDRLNLGVSMSRLGKDFNVSKRTIFRIKHNKIWKHVVI